MKCPYCENEMTRGTLRSRGGNYFLPDGETTPAWYTQKALGKRNAIALPPSPYDPQLPPERPVAYACAVCRRIIIPY